MSALKLCIDVTFVRASGDFDYVNHMLTQMSRMPNVMLQVVCDTAYQSFLHVPEGTHVTHVVLPQQYWKRLFWQQKDLPRLARVWGADATLHVSRFVALCAPRPALLLTPGLAGEVVPQTWCERLALLGRQCLHGISVVRSRVLLVSGKGMLPTWLARIRKARVVEVPPASGLTQIEGILRKPDMILAVGDFYAHKHYPELIKAFARIRQQRPDAKLVIVGRRVDQHEAMRAKSLIERHELADAVSLTGAVPHETLAELYATASVYISASSYEPFSLNLLEALAMNVPAVVKDYAFNRDIGGDEGALYAAVSQKEGRKAEEKNAQALCEGVMMILSDGAVRGVLREHGQAQSATFSWAKTAQKIVDALRE